MGMKSTIREWLKLLLIIVFLGTILIWIMSPTGVYRDVWVPKIRATADIPFFGAQGSRIMEYTFPMLFIAVVGCIYLHLGKKIEDENVKSGDKKKGPSRWRQPALVKGPLGVVSWIELVFVISFVALCIWTLAVFLQVAFDKITPENAATDGEKVWEAKLDRAALKTGLVGNLCLAFLFFPVTRGSSIMPLIGLTSESTIKYHVWLGHLSMFLFTVHGLCYIVFWASADRISEMVKWANVGVANVPGEFALVVGLVMWATTFPQIRRKSFELFFYTHYLYIIFVICFAYHAGITHTSEILPGIYLFAIDRYLRFLQSRGNVRLLSSRLLPCETVELNFSKSTALSYNTNSIIFVNVPSISKIQWHPFTISSSSSLEPNNLSIVIKREGSWSQKLYQALSSPLPSERLEIAVEGPYGPVSTHYLRHETLVMISGGSGITPFFAIIRELIFTKVMTNRKIPKILLVSAFKNSADLTMLDLLLPISGSPLDISTVQLQIEAYVTREEKLPGSAVAKNAIQTVWFKPKPTDQPISAILGSNYWLWLGVIISCSFIMFLILMGITTRYYIYPIDHNTNKIYSSPRRVSINLLFLCVSIFVVASAVVLKNKKRNAMEAKQIQITDLQSPTSSPSSFHNEDQELESVPIQSLVEATKIQYGSRPDLKKILFDCEGSSVGVLVSGPAGMRHDVATICSSGLADNLQYDSSSFSW